jgi:hypothetical protein
MGLWSKAPSEDDLRKYARRVLLGPLPFAIYALVVIVIGPIMINSNRRPEEDTGSLTTLYPNWRCKKSYDPTETITNEPKSNNPLYTLFLYWLGNIFFCYLFMMTFCWTLLGFPIRVNDLFSCWNAVFGIEGYTFTVGSVDINIGTKFHMLSDAVNFHLARPYTQLRWVAFVYILLFVFLTAINFGGLGIVMQVNAAGCWDLNPKLYYFTLFQVLGFMLLAFLKTYAFCKSMCGSTLGKSLRSAAYQKAKSASTVDDDTKYAKKQFMQYDRGEDQPEMEADDLEHLLADLGLKLPEADIEKIKKEIGGDDGIISLDEFLGWYNKSNEEEAQQGAADDSDEEGSSAEESDSD